jgi:hypothetical protein
MMNMIGFWCSIDRLTGEGLKVAWFGAVVVLIGLLVPDVKWLSWFGLAATVIGLILRHRAEHLKRLQATPRTLTELQTTQILGVLNNVPKQAMTVGFFGQDVEAEQFAGQIKKVLEQAGFKVVRLEGFMVFRLQYGLTITVFNSDSSIPTALGIQKAFQAGGFKIEYETNPNRMEPPIALNVHGKPPHSENVALGQPLSHGLK